MSKCTMNINTCTQEKTCVPQEEKFIKSLEKKEAPEGTCEQYKSLNKGSFKSNVKFIKTKEKILILFQQTEIKKSMKYDIMKEALIQKEVHDKAGSQYAPDVYRLDYYSTCKGEEISLLTGYAGDDGYKQLKDIKELVNFMEVYPCVDNSCNDEIYEFFFKGNNEFNNFMNDQLGTTDTNYRFTKDQMRYYATLFNPKNYKNCLEQWYMRCEHFFVSFFRDLHELHKIDVFHHDLKRENVWYKEDDTGYHFKFIDFGISTSLEETIFDNIERKDIIIEEPEQDQDQDQDQEQEPVKRKTRKSTANSKASWIYTGGEDKKTEQKTFFTFDPPYLATIWVRKDTIMNEMKSGGFSKQTLKDLMMVELTKPNTTPQSASDKEAYIDFVFFNYSIDSGITTFFIDSLMNSYLRTVIIGTKKSKRTGKPMDITLFDKKKELRNGIVQTYIEFIADKYAESNFKHN